MIHPSDRNAPVIEVKDTIGELHADLAAARKDCCRLNEERIRLEAEAEELRAALKYARERKSFYKRRSIAIENVLAAADLLGDLAITVKVVRRAFDLASAQEVVR